MAESEEEATPSLTTRDRAALLQLAGYSGSAHEGVRSVVERLSTPFARQVAAALLGPSPGSAVPDERSRAEAERIRGEAASTADDKRIGWLEQRPGALDRRSPRPTLRRRRPTE
jgi:hypothetical protein